MTNDTRQATTLINRKTLLAMIPLADRTIYNMEKRGDFPRRIVLTSRNVAWDLAEVLRWIEARKQSSAQACKPGLPMQGASPFQTCHLRDQRAI